MTLNRFESVQIVDSCHEFFLCSHVSTQRVFSLQDFTWSRAHLEGVNVLGFVMASPFRRKPKDRAVKVDEDDLELEEVVGSEEPLEENVAEVLESLDLDQALFESAKRVTHTCMDIRRGENVLIVCDPTTGQIGQALHKAATERSDRVLLLLCREEDIMRRSPQLL